MYRIDINSLIKKGNEIMFEFTLSSIINVVYLISMVVFFGFGQKIQMFAMLLGVRGDIKRLGSFRDSAHQQMLNQILRYNSNQNEVEKALEQLTRSFVITPTSLDPAGIVGKLEHVLDTYDTYLKSEVRQLATGASNIEVSNLTNLLEVSITLDIMFRVVRHFYLQSKKQGGMMALMQLQMDLPIIMEEAKAYHSAEDAFVLGKAVGDGVGPLVAKHFYKDNKGKELIKDTDVYESSFEGRRLLIVRAKGPGGNVGKPGLAIEKLIQKTRCINRIITVDAALKFEGENSGAIAEGVGAAIGGPGTERYHIEEAATKRRIPLNAVVVKMSSKEAISIMTSEIREAVEEATYRIKTIILSKTKPGCTIILAGIGNTIGIE